MDNVSVRQALIMFGLFAALPILNAACERVFKDKDNAIEYTDRVFAVYVSVAMLVIFITW